MLNSSNILIVEDDVTTIKVLEAYLGSWGYQVSATARTMQKALEEAQKSPPDLALLDINLGRGMERDGIELAFRFRQHYRFPIIFLTGQPELQVMKQASAARPDAYLTKPISEPGLAFAIDQALQKASERLVSSEEVTELPSLSQEGQYYLLEDHLFVKRDHAYQKLAVRDILWIQADQQYSNIQTVTNTLLVSTNLGNLLKQFKHPELLRVSRSHIVNVHHIEGFEESHTVIVGGQAIPIGKTYRDLVQKKFRFIKTTR